MCLFNQLSKFLLIVTFISVGYGDLLTFTTCGQSGPTGPSQEQCNTAYNEWWEVSVSGGIQQFTAPRSGTYYIDGHGAQGGNNGGAGARMSGEFYLDIGEVLNIVVGQQGSHTTGGAGGGGGTFVYKNTNELLIAAGGGSGTGDDGNYNVGHVSEGSNGGCGGDTGYAGGCSGNDSSGAGAGWHSSDTYSTGCGDCCGNTADLIGAKSKPYWTGGYAYRHCWNNHGGFGGGGGGIHPAGGGGGYSGGGGNYNQGGGGSYNSGQNQSNQSGENSGHGYVSITLPPVPIEANPYYSGDTYNNALFNHFIDKTFILSSWDISSVVVDSIKIVSGENVLNEIPQLQVIGSDAFTIESESTYDLIIRYFPHLNELYTEDLSGIQANVWFYIQTTDYPVLKIIPLSANSFVNLSASPTNHSFNDVPLGTFVEQDISFTNTTGEMQEIIDILPGYFDYSDSSFVELSEFTIENETQYELNPGESQTITVRYTPQDLESEDLFLYSFGPDYVHHIMPISGSSELPTVDISPEYLDFGNVQVGAYSDQLISVSPDFNIGEIDVIDVNTNSSVFSIVSDTSFTILPEEVIPLTVRFTPTDIDSSYTSELSIIATAGDSTTVLGTTTLSGTGTSESANNFILISPTNTTGVSVHAQFQWTDAFNGATGNYKLRYGPEVPYDGADIYIEVNGITDTRYYVENDLPIGAQLYWMVWAVQADGTETPVSQFGFFEVETELPELNGPIPGPRTLLPENSPYIVTGDVQVLETNNLTIPAGIEILFEENFGIEVAGELVVLGEEENRVEFKSVNDSGPSSWKEIKFTNTAINLILDENNNVLTGSHFHHMTITDAGSNGLPALDGYWDGRSVTKSFLMDNCDISNNDGPGMRVGHLSYLTNNTINSNNGYAIDGGAYYSNNTLDSNQGYGINTLAGQVFTENTIINNNGYAIVTALGQEFTDNLIDGNSGNGITTDLGGVFTSNVIQNNSGYGIYAGLGETFASNDVLDNGSYGIKTEAGESFTDNNVSGNNGFGIETTTAYSSGAIIFSSNMIDNNTGEYGDFNGGVRTSILAEFSDNVITNNTGFGVEGGRTFLNDNISDNSYYGIYTGGGESFVNLTVDNNGDYGITTVTGNVFDSNHVGNNGWYGIRTYKGQSFTNNEVFSNHDFGIETSTDVNNGVIVFTDNYIHDNQSGQAGVWDGGIKTNILAELSNNVITDNTGDGVTGGRTFSNDEVSGNTGYGIYTSGGETFEALQVNNNNGHGIFTDTGNSFINNTVTGNGSYGILTNAGENFENNIVTDNGSYGIDTNTGNFFTSNIVSNNGSFGINTEAGNDFELNVVENNQGFGIDTDTGNIFSENTVSGNSGWGINTDAGESFNLNIVLSNTQHGIDTNTGNSFTNNTISNNSTDGLIVSPGDSLSISLSGNTFEGNMQNGLSADITTDISIDSDIFSLNKNNAIVIQGNATSVTIANVSVTGDLEHNYGSSTPSGSENGLRILNAEELNVSGSSINNNYASGIYLDGTSNITITSNSFEGNKWVAINQFGDGSTSTISNNTFTDNQNITQSGDNKGGAIYTDIPDVQIASNSFTGNIATYGGAIYINSGSPYIYDNLMSSNTSYQSGGAIYIGGSVIDSPIIKFNTIAGDTSHTDLGGGIFIHNQGNSRTVINENVISDNYGYGVYGDPDSLMYNNIVGNLDEDGNPGFNLFKSNATDMVGTADQNWWGTTSNAEIFEMIWDGFDDGDNLGYVTINSSLPWPSPHAPGQVGDAISIQLYEDDSYEEVLTYSPGVGSTLYIELEAVDENPYAADQTPVTATNINGFALFDILASETDLNSGIFRGNIEVQETSNPFQGIIGASIGDTIRVYSTVDEEVELFVTIAGPADVTLSEDSITRELAPYSEESQSVTVYNSGSGYLNANLETSESWLSLSTDHIEIIAGDSIDVDLIFTSDSLSNGNYSSFVSVIYDDEIDTLDVNMLVENRLYSSSMQVEAGTVNAVPLMVDLNDGENLSGFVFGVQVEGVDAPSLIEDLDFELLVEGSDPFISVVESGYVTIAVSDLDPMLEGFDVHFGNLLVDVPSSAQEYQLYGLSLSGASGSDDSFDLVNLSTPVGSQLEVFITNLSPYFDPEFSDVNMLEGDMQDVGFTVVDPEGTDMTVSLIDAPSFVSLNHTTGESYATLDLSPNYGDNSGQVVISVSDSGNPNVTTIDSFMVNVNHYPGWDVTGGIELLEGTSTTITVSLSDSDGDSLSLSLDSGSPDYVSLDGLDITVSPDIGADDGVALFTLSDNGNPSAVVELEFPIDILHTPTIDQVEDQTMNEDELLSIDLNVVDQDGDDISILASSDNEDIVAILDSLTLTLTPTENYFGDGTISIIASDGVYEAYSSFTISVLSVNDAPLAEDLSYDLDEDSSVVFEFSASDVDEDDLTFTIIQNPENGIVSGFEYIPNSNYYGVDQLTYQASDGELADTATVTFNVISDNDLPVISGLENDVHIPENNVYVIDVYFSDTDGDMLTYTLDGVDYCASADNGENTIQITCSPDSDSQSSSLALTLSDNDDSVSESIEVYIYNTYLAGDVRPVGDDLNSDGDSEDAGEFGDDLVVAPDVINALKLITASRDVVMPDSTSNLYSSFDVMPEDVDLNEDGDCYDEGERGGDGELSANDVILSLLRATNVDGYDDIRRVDLEYPYTTQEVLRISTLSDGSDTLSLSNVCGVPGQLIDIPVYVKKGQDDELYGLATGFEFIDPNEQLSLDTPITFVEDSGSVFASNSGNDYLSLLLMDMMTGSSTDIYIGDLQITIPENAQYGDEFIIASQSPSGSTENYDIINIDPGELAYINIDMMQMGDLTQDCQVNVADIIVLIDIVIDLYEFNTFPSDLEIEFGDIYPDGELNVVDIVGLVNIILDL